MADYQLTFGGLTIGAGTNIQILGATGLEDLPAVRSGDLDVGYMDGQVPGLDLASGREITVDVLVLDSGAGDYFTTIEALKAATVVASAESTLTYQLPGRAARACRARPRRRSIPVDTQYQFRYGKGALQFYATDPRWYDTAFTAAAMSLPSATSGLTFPATASFVFGSAGTGGSVVVNNLGNYPAPWVATFTGPLVQPSLQLGSQVVTFAGTLNAGETLVVDSLGRSVLLNGTASRYSWVTSTSVWWFIPIGSSSVQFNAASGTGTCSFAYRSCWL